MKKWKSRWVIRTLGLYQRLFFRFLSNEELLGRHIVYEVNLQALKYGGLTPAYSSTSSA